VISPVQEFAAEFHGMVTQNLGEVIRNVGAAHDGQAGYEDLVSKATESGDVEPHRTQLIREYVEVRVIPLGTKFILCARAEDVKPGALDRVRIRMD
jgi:hypothetical protein